MRQAHNLLLAATAAIAAIAFMAASASAQSIEVHPEGSAFHCTNVDIDEHHIVTGGCLIHIVSEDNLVLTSHGGAGEAAFTSCVTEHSARINEDGSGYGIVNDPSIATGIGGCVITPCDEEGFGSEITHPELEWPISGLIEYGGGREAMIMTFCIRPIGPHESEGNIDCTTIVDITQIASHRQELSANEAPCFENGGLIELSGHWVTEATPNTDAGEVEVEMEHIHYP